MPKPLFNTPGVSAANDHALTRPGSKNYTQKKLAPFNRGLVTLNWTKDKPDPRDYIYQAKPVSTPREVDLRRWCTLVENQEELGSCTGQAIAGAIEYLNKRANKPTDVSRLYIYWFERMYIGTVNWDSGAYIRDGIRATSHYGAPLERLWPYRINRFTIKPDRFAMADGSRRKVTLYERASSVSDCINSIANGFPVVVGFHVYESFFNAGNTFYGVMDYPNTAEEELLGGHAVLLVGYDNSRRRFIARNSWGMRWGDKGYFYMPYAVIDDRGMSDDFWVIRNVRNP